MSIEIYYFSSTGNSLVVARDIARKLRGTLIPVASVVDKRSINTGADVIGMVFPVYYSELSGIPLIIGQFVRKLNKIASKYIFAVCTHQGKPDLTLMHLGKMISSRGGAFAARFTVKMSVQSPIIPKMKKALLHQELNTVATALANQNKLQMLFNKWKEKLAVICKCVNAREMGKFEPHGTLFDMIFAPLLPLLQQMHLARLRKLANAPRLPFPALIHQADRSFHSDEKCNGCEICARVCPVGNIKMVDHRPS